jgi:DNA-binding helix-turn-helix protein
MELNKESTAYPSYTRLLEQYTNRILKDDDVILIARNYDGTIAEWFYNHDFMQKCDLDDSELDFEDSTWLLFYKIESECNNLTEALVLDVILELEYQLVGSPKIKDLREELGLKVEELAIKLRIPARTLDRIEKGLEIPPSYVMRSIYVRLVNEVEHNRFKDRIEKLGEENPNDNFMDLLYKDLFGNQNDEALEAVNAAEMLDDSIDNLGKNKKNNFEDKNIYITPSKSEIDKFMKKLKDDD